MSNITIDSTVLKNLLALIENKTQVETLAPELQAILKQAENDCIAKVKDSLTNIVEGVADAIIETIAPASIAPVIETIANPLVDSEIPAIENEAQMLLQKVESFI